MDERSEYTNVKISRGTYEELCKLGTLKDSFDSVIRRLIENEKKKQEVIAAR